MRQLDLQRIEHFEHMQEATARWRGYESAVQMNPSHDLLHASLCRWLGVTSHALRQANGERLTREEQMLANLEGDAVMAVQRWLKHSGAEVPR